MPTAPEQLVASLKMIASLPRIGPDESYQLPATGLWEALRPKIRELATKRNSLVGSAAVEALVKLNAQRESQLYWSTLRHLIGIMDKAAPDVPFPNILGYLSNVLPLLDAEGGGVSSTDNVDDLPFVLRVNGDHQTLLRTL